jgi:ribonuclease J
MFVVATVSADEGKTLADHEILLRGVPLADDDVDFEGAVREAIETTLDRAADEDVHVPDMIQQMLHDDLAELVYKRLRRRPMIVPVVVEV